VFTELGLECVQEKDAGHAYRYSRPIERPSGEQLVSQQLAELEVLDLR
jgi:hypothetical protein